MLFALNGFGAVDTSAFPVLNQSLVPYLGKPVYLRLTNSLAKAKNYAAAGFHVSVTRGLGGGCSDPASTVDGTDNTGSACISPMNRQDAVSTWADAAQAYSDAYYLANSGASLDAVKAQLTAANAKADAGYHLEGVAPPADPVLVAQNAAAGLPAPSSEPVAGSKSSSVGLWVGLALGTVAAAGLGVAIYKGAKARTKKKSNRAYQYAY